MAVVIQRHWRKRQSIAFSAACATIRETRCRCCVCHDETTSVVLCPNGHPTCTGCDASIDDQSCPICRDNRAITCDTTVEYVARTLNMRFRCALCNHVVSSDDVEFHRGWCPAHEFECPCDGCNVVSRDMSKHIKESHGSLPRSNKHLLLVCRFSSNIVFMVDDIVVVASFNTERNGGMSELLSGHMNLHMRAYYPNPNVSPLNATVKQKRIVDVQNDTALETFHVGVVPPVLASRERIVVSTYVPHIVPRCILNKAIPLGNPPLRIVNGMDDLRRHCVYDIPLYTNPRRNNMHSNGMPVAIVELSFDRMHGERIGEVYSI